MSNSLKESDDGLCRSFAVKTSLLPFFQGQKIEMIENDEKLATLYEGNLKIVQASSGAPVLDLFDYNDEHREIVTSFCVHPSKREVVIANSKFVLKHYNLEDKSCIRSIRGHNMPIICMSYDSTGQLVATGSADRIVRVWDIDKGYCTHNFRNHTEVVTITKFHPLTNQMKLFSASDDTTIKCYDLMEQKCVANFQDHYHTPTGIEVSPLGNVLVSVSRDKVINFYNLVTMTVIKTLPISEELEGLVVLSAKHASEILGVDRLGLGSSKLTIGGGGFGDSSSGKKNSKSKSSSGSGYGEASLETFMFLTAGQGSVIRLYKVSVDLAHKETFSCETFFELRVGLPSTDVSTNALQSLYYLRNKGKILVASSELNLHYFSISKATSAVDLGSLKLDIHLSGGNDDILDIVNIPPLIENNNIGSSRASNSDEDEDDDEVVDNEGGDNDDGGGHKSSNHFRLAVVTNSTHVKLVYDKFYCSLLFGHKDIVLSACASPDGKYLITSSKDKTCRVWDLQTHKCVLIATGHTDSIGTVGVCQRVSTLLSKQGFFMSGGLDKVLKRFEFIPERFERRNDDNMDDDDEEQEESITRVISTHSVRAHDKDISSIAVSPNDQIVATGSQDKQIKLWQTHDLSPVATLRGHRRGVWKICFSPVDKCLLSCSGDRTLKLWSMSDYSCLQTFEGHSGSILNAVFINKGMQIMSSAADGLIRLWSIRTGECEATFDKHVDRVWALATISKSKFFRGMDGLISCDSNNGDDICDQIFISGGSDSALHFWQDTTVFEENKRIEAEEETLIVEQNMWNDIRNKRYGRALRSALEINHASKVAMILSAILEEEDEKSYLASSASVTSSKCSLTSSGPSFVASVTGIDDEVNDIDFGIPIFERLDSFIYKLSMIEDTSLLARLIGFTRDWNTSSRQCHIAQAVVHSLMRVVRVQKLSTFSHASETAKALLSYNERHYQRLDKLYQASFLLEYMTSMMALYPLENKINSKSNDEMLSKMFDKSTEHEDVIEEDFNFVPNIFGGGGSKSSSSKNDISNFDSDVEDAVAVKTKKSGGSAKGNAKENSQTSKIEHKLESNVVENSSSKSKKRVAATDEVTDTPKVPTNVATSIDNSGEADSSSKKKKKSK